MFGATGMVGQGVLRECLLDPNVQLVATIGRSATGQQNPKLREIVLQDLSHYAPIEDQLSGFDACFFCLGISASGMTEEAYARITSELLTYS
jgi:aspartate-semialdehyde dehydrogenase